MLAALVMAPVVATGHDTWLIPWGSEDAGDTSLTFALATGEEFPHSNHATDPERVDEWVVLAPDRRLTLTDFETDGKDLTVTYDNAAPGVRAAGVVLYPRYIELTPTKFDAYLKSERAEEAIAQRKATNATGRVGRELYTKCAKTFVGSVSAGDGDTWNRALGHPLEIIPVTNPTTWQVGDEIAVRVLLEGGPARGFLVGVAHAGLPPHSYADTDFTNGDGVARLKLTKKGLWFVRVHHIRLRSSEASGADAITTGPAGAAEWESFWATLTFTVPDEAGPPKSGEGEGSGPDTAKPDWPDAPAPPK